MSKRKVAIMTWKMSKLAKISEQSSASTRIYRLSYVFIFKTTRFRVNVRLFSNRSQKTSKFGKNNSLALARGSCASYDISTSSAFQNRRTKKRN